MNPFAYEEYNEELNIEGKNIRLLKGVYLTRCIVFGETNQHTKTSQDRAVKIAGISILGWLY
jgi:hypothetical protein